MLDGGPSCCLSSNSGNYVYYWFTLWMDAVGVDFAQLVLKILQQSGATMTVVPVLQTAAVRKNNPDAPAIIGSTSQVGNGEVRSVLEDISSSTNQKRWVRFGVGFKSGTPGTLTAALVGFQLFLSTFGKVVAEEETQQVVAFDSSNYFKPLTPWLPARMVSAFMATIVVTQPTSANFKVGLAVQTANTSVESPNAWAGLGSVYNSGENNTGEQTVTYGSPPEFWVRAGLKFTMLSGTLGSAVVTTTVSARY
jgi:hypothetical protein